MVLFLHGREQAKSIAYHGKRVFEKIGFIATDREFQFVELIKWLYRRYES